MRRARVAATLLSGIHTLRRLGGLAVALGAGGVAAVLAGAGGCSGSASIENVTTYGFDGGTATRATDARHDAPAILRTPDAETDEDCPANARLIYVTGEGSSLYSYNPAAGKFTLIGTLDCLETPTHMTVDRQGRAWIVGPASPSATADTLYMASTVSASCHAVATWTPDPVHFQDLALTFLGTTSATDNSLYMLGTSGELGVFDIPSGTMKSVGAVALSSSGDMTTNGDGHLYFLIQAATQTLNELDPTNAAVVKSYTTGEDSQNTQALAYWGGLFFDFIGTAVYTYDVKTKTAKAIGTAPILVTGAGQSTCVPADAGAPPVLH